MNWRQSIKVALGVSRPGFLLLAPAVLMPVFVYAYQQKVTWDWALMGLILLVAVAAHIAVNALNEYQDFQSGLDRQTRRTPFSGGSGTLVNYPAGQFVALIVAVFGLIVAVAGGLLLVTKVSGELLVPGVVGVFLIVSYTRWINRWPVLCLFAPGLGFGLIMVNGTGLCLLGRFDPAVFVMSLLATCQCSSLLLMNQFPDIEADRAVGRRHVLIAYGIQKGVSLYIGLILVSYLLLITAVSVNVLPAAALTGLLTVPLAVKVIDQLRQSTTGVEVSINQAFVDAMARNVAVTLLTPLATALGLVLFSAGPA